MGFGPIPKEALESTEDSPAQSAIANSQSATIRYFGDYELLEQIGQGGMGVVFKARQISLRRLVALKMISAGELASPTAVQRFHVEAEAAAKLDHPNIVPIYEIGVHQGQHYFSMKLVEGGSLQERVAREKESRGESVKGIRQAATLLAKIARSVHYAHQHGVIHRDLKPANILIDAQGEPHLTDFGLAKILEHEIGVTRTAELMGTPSYMSPEQATGRQLSTATDVWSLGVILYEQLMIRLPFCAENTPALLRTIVEQEPTPPRSDKIDRDLETICLKCLEKDPARRYTSAAALADDLGHWLRDEPVLTRRTGAFERITKWVRRKPALATVAGVALVLFLVVVVGSPVAILRIANQRERAKQEAARAQAAVVRLEIERAESMFGMQSAARGVAYLARLVRQYPTKAVVAERLVNALSANSYCLPSAPPLKHADKVTCAQFSPDGEFVLTASKDGTARIWASSDGAEIGDPLRHSAAIRWAEFSQDGHCVVTASDDGSALVWDVQTRQPISPPLRHHDQVIYTTFSPEGERVVTASRDRTVQCWHWKKGSKASPTIKTTAEAYFAAFSPSGDELLVAIDDGTARIFSCTNGDELASYPHRRQAESAVPFPQYSPQGDRVVTLQADGAKIWKVSQRDSAPVHLPHGRDVTSAVFSRDGRQVATASIDNTARVWDARTGASVTGTNLRDDALAVRFSIDGRLLLAGTADNLLMVLSCRSGEPQAQPLRHESRVTQVQFNPRRNQAVAVTDGNHAVLWGIRRVKVAPREFTHKNQAHHAVFSPDGHRVVTGSRDCTACVWDIVTGQPITPPLRQKGWINVVRFSPDGQRIATVSENQEVQIWDASTGEPLMKPAPESTATQILDLQYSSDGRTIGLATGGSGGGWIVDSATGKVIFHLPHAGSVRCIAFSPDGRWIATACKDGSSRIWSVQTGQPVNAPLRHDDVVHWLEFSPDSQRLATASRDKSVRIWDCATGRMTIKPLLHADSLGEKYSVQFSPDGKWLATAAGKAAQVWKTESGHPSVLRFEHATPVKSVRFSSDGHRLIAATKDVRIWDVVTGHALSDPHEHDWGCTYAEFSPDGRFALTASVDGRTRIWWMPQVPKMRPDWLPDLAEGLSGRRIDEADTSDIVPVEKLFVVAKKLITPTSGPYQRTSEGALPNSDEFYPAWGYWFLTESTERILPPWLLSGTAKPKGATR